MDIFHVHVHVYHVVINSMQLYMYMFVVLVCGCISLLCLFSHRFACVQWLLACVSVCGVTAVSHLHIHVQ